MNNFKIYCILWLSQAFSLLGNSMTSFSLSLWVFNQTNSAFSLSLLIFCWFLPWIVLSAFIGGFIDSHKKRNILMISDFFSSFITLMILILMKNYDFDFRWIYLANFLNGCCTAFQEPAQDATLGILVPADKYGKASGMNSFSDSLVSISAPILAASIFSWKGLYWIFAIDFITFLFAFIVLYFVKIPEKIQKQKVDKTQNLLRANFKNSQVGFRWLIKNSSILKMMIFMALMNFFSRLTYQNILVPMILARSSGNSYTLGIVTSVMGVAGIIGGIAVTFVKKWKNNVKIIFISTALSFIFGDLFMAIGNNLSLWLLGGLFASLPFPFIAAAQNNILYKKIPKDLQGRVFAARNTIQYSLIPIGILTGGWLADNIFEPFMSSQNKSSLFLEKIVGSGNGSGMALMFLFTGIIGFLLSIFILNDQSLKELSKEIDSNQDLSVAVVD